MLYQPYCTVSFQLYIYTDTFINTLFYVLLHFSPITYGILRFCQLRGEGGLFGPDPENKVSVNGLILKFGTNNGTDDTSKHAKF